MLITNERLLVVHTLKRDPPQRDVPAGFNGVNVKVYYCLMRYEMEIKMNKSTTDYKEHTAPWECTYAKDEKGRCRPGKKPSSDKDYFEILSLCVLQAGLGWGMVRKDWSKYKRSFLNFKINLLADAEVEDLLGRPGMIKNRKKVMAILNNAKEFRNIKEEHGSFSNFLKTLKEDEDDKAIEELTRRFHYLGEYSVEYFLHSVSYWE